jgi:signal transduction histidine kinase
MLTRWLRAMDPRRSLGAGATWLIIGLAITFSVSAGIWVGSIARENVLEQHVRRLRLETDQLSSDLGQALAARLDAIDAAGRIVAAHGGDRPGSLSEIFSELTAAYPELDWIAAADGDGTVRGTSGEPAVGSEIASSPWFLTARNGPWLGVIDSGPHSSNTAALGDMAAPVRDSSGRVIGVVASHLRWRRAPDHPERLTDESDPRVAAQAFVLDRDGLVLVGPDGTRNRRWSGTPVAAAISADLRLDAPQFERLPDGRRVLVARELLIAGRHVSSLGWQVQLSEPKERVYQRADAIAFEILWVSLGLAVATCLLGILGARQLTGRLRRLTESVTSVGQNAAQSIDIPDGVDEVAQLARAFARILGDLQDERRELQTLSGELERRVAVRTREVERLAEESRYAAIVRERLKIARELHDTLAHSMMAILSEIRFLRKLQAREPAALAEELARAETVAHEGLKEARSAITQMRATAVRETGLGPALSREFESFLNRTGVIGEFDAEPEPARFGDERAETLMRMAQEALRNIERHSKATRVAIGLKTVDDGRIELRIEDNGIGFDPLALRPGHYGLVGLREQAESIGADLILESGPQGTAVRIRLRVGPARFVP